MFINDQDRSSFINDQEVELAQSEIEHDDSIILGFFNLQHAKLK